MTLAAKLYQSGRAFERHEVNLGGTLRDSLRSAYDTTLEDLSATGFLTPAVTSLEIGEIISLGLTGVGLRRARVVRADERGYGCEFLVPLRAEELNRTMTPGISATAWLPAPLYATGAIEMPEPYVVPFANRTKTAIIVGLAGLSWLVVIATASVVTGSLAG